MPESSPSAEFNDDDALTLDPPGRIAVIGAGPIGLECALYGRYLGYDVVVIEADRVGGSLCERIGEPLPMMPDRCLSSLGLGAIDAQLDPSQPRTLPLTIEAWINEGLVQIAASDLLAERMMMPIKCVSIELVPVEADDAGEASESESDGDSDDGEIPPDFLLQLVDESGESHSLRSECVMLAGGGNHGIELAFPSDTPYFFQLGHESVGDLEADLRRGWREIASIYASLMGRADLDLYRPRRM